MSTETQRILEAVYAAWAARDLKTSLSHFAPDVVFVMHLSRDVVPFAGEVRGRDELGKRLQTILDEFDFIEYRPTEITPAGEDSYESHVHFRYRHKTTGHEVDSTMRHLIRFQADKIVRFEELHDAERLRPFFAQMAAAGGGWTSGGG